jgi:CBS domain-containing protein
MAATESLPILHLSLITGGVLRDGAGGQLGRVDDVVVRLGADYPVVSGVLATVAGRQVFVPADVVREIGHGYVELSEVRLDLRPFERRAEEVLLKQDVLDRQLINVEGARLVRTNEIELARVDGWYRVVGVDTGLRGLTRRVLPRRFAGRVVPGQFLDWASVEPFTGHVPTVRLRVPHPKLARLHPAQLADLVEAASHREGEEIMSALADEELEADVFEELDTQHQREFIEERTDAEVAGVLARMESDDAVDMLGELVEERRRRILELLPPLQARRVRALAGYDPATAGGLMSPDFICLYATATKREAVERIRRDQVKANSVTSIFTMNLHRRLQGEIRLADLIRAEDDAVLADLATVKPRVVTPDTEVEEIARLMTDYDLTIVAVTGAKGELMGVVTVDDVLELVLPRGWRRKFDLFGGE